MLSKWLMKRKLNRISKQLNKLTKEIIDSIHAENMKNIMASYRVFYNPSDGHVLGFKPVFEKVITDIIKKEGK